SYLGSMQQLRNQIKIAASVKACHRGGPALHTPPRRLPIHVGIPLLAQRGSVLLPAVLELPRVQTAPARRDIQLLSLASMTHCTRRGFSHRGLAEIQMEGGADAVRVAPCHAVSPGGRAPSAAGAPTPQRLSSVSRSPLPVPQRACQWHARRP